MTEITILSGGKEFKYLSKSSTINVIKDLEKYGFIQLLNNEVLKASKDKFMILKEVD